MITTLKTKYRMIRRSEELRFTSHVTHLSNLVHSSHHVLVQHMEHEDVAQELRVLAVDVEDHLVMPDRVLRVLPHLALGLALTHAVDIHLYLDVGVCDRQLVLNRKGGGESERGSESGGDFTQRIMHLRPDMNC